jgi:ABC-type nitrate/sulfonate/bicarbonate transport system permease component
MALATGAKGHHPSASCPADRQASATEGAAAVRSPFAPTRRLRAAKLPLGFLQGVGSLLVAALIWELTARLLIKSPLLFVPITSVAVRAVELWQVGELQNHIWVSFVEFSGGFGLSVIAGIVLGVVLASSRFARNFFEPWVSMLYSTPIIALGPLFILWLGIGVASKIAIVFLTAVFPILINTVIGLTTTERTLIEVARAFGAGQAQIYTKIRIPAALPFIIAGLRIGVARALVGVVVAELFGARGGLGFMILTSAQNFDTAALFVGVIILAFAGIASVEFLKWIEQRLAPWRFQESGE